MSYIGCDHVLPSQQTFHIGPMLGRHSFACRPDISFNVGPRSDVQHGLISARDRLNHIKRHSANMVPTYLNTARYRPEIGYTAYFSLHGADIPKNHYTGPFKSQFTIPLVLVVFSVTTNYQLINKRKKQLI